MFLFQRNLVVAILHIKDSPHFELPLPLKDVLDPRQGVGVRDRRVIQGAVVHHHPLLTGGLFGDRERGATPRGDTRL